jgi:hypothetical protein
MTTELLESAKQALIDQARAAYRHVQELDKRDIKDAAKQVAYGQMIGSVEALAVFLDATLPGDDEDQDPTGMARAYAEGRELEDQ